MKKLEDYVLSIPDFPKPGILFRDVTSVIADPDGLQLAVQTLEKMLDGVEYDAIAGVESRGFVFGVPLAYNQHKPFLMVRKAGKLPRETVKETYDLEYGRATIEMHRDDIRPGMKIVLVDDLIATGGSSAAGVHLIEKLGGKVVKIIFLMELKGLNGREALKGYDVESAIQYEGK